MAASPHGRVILAIAICVYLSDIARDVHHVSAFVLQESVLAEERKKNNHATSVS